MAEIKVTELSSPKKLYLCGGLQSSGSTYLSWCFLQRQDMNGYFDANNDILNVISPDIGQPFVWYKTTISCFRLSELVNHYTDEGWDVTPILVIRDPRNVWSSLVNKKYGRNGTTAEDPPLRMRMRRFKEDWEYCRAQGWPIIRFESFLKNPEQVLRETCEQLNLSWDASMLTWPKSPDQIEDVRHGSRTFKINRSQGLTNSPRSKPCAKKNILSGDLQWLEKEFKDFNVINDYIPYFEISSSVVVKEQRLIPQFVVTRRRDWRLQRKPFRWLMARILKRKPQLLQF